MSAAVASEAGCFALYRGHDRNGAPQERWNQLGAKPQTSAEARDECEGMFGCGLLWHPERAEFLVCELDGTPLFTARPPHVQALRWDAVEATETKPIPENANSTAKTASVDTEDSPVDGNLCLLSSPVPLVSPRFPLPAFVPGKVAGMVGRVVAGSS